MIWMEQRENWDVRDSVGNSEPEKDCFVRTDEKEEDFLKHRRKDGG